MIIQFPPYNHFNIIIKKENYFFNKISKYILNITVKNDIIVLL